MESQTCQTCGRNFYRYCLHCALEQLVKARLAADQIQTEIEQEVLQNDYYDREREAEKAEMTEEKLNETYRD